MTPEITEGAKCCEKAFVQTFRGVWSCMLDEGHASDTCIVVPRSERDERRAGALLRREADALRAEVEALRAERKQA